MPLPHVALRDRNAQVTRVLLGLLALVVIRIAAAHGVADPVELTLRRESGLREVVVHVEPC